MLNKGKIDKMYKEYGGSVYNIIEDVLEDITKMIRDEMMVCYKEGTPTSRLTSLYCKINDLYYNK